MNTWEQGTILHSVKDRTICIDRLCTEGTMGAVYDVTVEGEKRILRWFRGDRGLEALWESTREKMEAGAPSKSFFWPEDMTDFSEAGFGYVTRPEMKDGISFHEVLRGSYTFPGRREMCNVALNLAISFGMLHRGGFCMDLHGGDFRFSSRSGLVLFSDTEAIVPLGKKRQVRCPIRYCAPEVLKEGSAPGVETDRYVLGIYLFSLFCRCHPLEGMRQLVPLVTPQVERELYAENPLFLFDRENGENRPHPVIHRGVSACWNSLPGYIQDLFHRLFGQAGLASPEDRPSEEEWIRALCRMKNDWFPCTCGQESLAWGLENPACERCGKPLPRFTRLILPEYAMPVVKDRKLYRCQLGDCEWTRMLETPVRVVEDPQKPGLRLKNTSGKEWGARTPSGAEKTVLPEELVPAMPGITLYIDGVEVRIE